MIQIRMPEAFEPAKAFVRSVLRNGYSDSAAVMRVVDDCARISFAAIGESFDPEKDLIQVRQPEPEWDKRPGFLTCLPLSAKLEVCREAARHGITSRAKYNIMVSYPNTATVVVTDPEGAMAEPIRLNYHLPVPPPNWHRMPPSRISNPALTPGNPTRPDSLACLNNAVGVSINEVNHHAHGGYQSGYPTTFDAVAATSDFIGRSTFGGAPPCWGEEMRYSPGNGNDRCRTNQIHQPFDGQNHSGEQTGYNRPDPCEIARKSTEKVMKVLEEIEYKRRQLQQAMMETHYESYSGTDLKPLLTPPGEEYARLHAASGIEPSEATRNYMAGEGRFISRVGFEQQMAGESAYGYAMNNPVTYIDPDGKKPKVYGDCKELVNVHAGIQLACDAIKSNAGQACINRLGPDYKNCISNWCNSDVAIRCGSRACAQFQRQHPNQCLDAITSPPSGIFKCQITICTGHVGTPSCWPTGITNVQQYIALTLLHEAMHCCGMLDHARNGKDPNNPAEDVARCIMCIPGHFPAYDINI